jgi:heptaprenyl diphosphate synthase
MHIAYRYFSRVFSLIGVSIIGAAAHNFAQVSVAVMMLSNARIYSYLPFLLLISLFSGYFVGLSSTYIVENLKKNFRVLFSRQETV